MQNIALAWLVIELSGSALAVGALAFCRFAPFLLLGLVAGVLIDRFDTRRLLVVTQGPAMLVSVVLAIVTLTGSATLPLVFALAAVGGLVLVFDAPGRQTLTFQMVGPEGAAERGCAQLRALQRLPRDRACDRRRRDRARRNRASASSSTRSASSRCSSRCASCARRSCIPSRSDPETRVVAGIREGFAWAYHAPVARVVLSVITVVSLVGFNFHVLVPLLASQTLDVGAETFGILASAFGLGALVGALATRASARRRTRVFVGGATGFSVLMVLLALVDSVALALVLLFGLGPQLRPLHLERERARPAQRARAICAGG